MQEHLSELSLERYRRRTMEAAELLRADDHLAGCEQCLARASEAAQARTVLAAFGDASPAREGSDHLTYEQLAAYTDGELDEVGREIADVHLEVCLQCAEEVRGLAALKEEPAPVRDVRAPAVAVPEKSGWPRRLFAGWRPARVAWAALALLLVGTLLWALRPRPPVSPVEVVESVRPTPGVGTPAPTPVGTAAPTPVGTAAPTPALTPNPSVVEERPAVAGTDGGGREVRPPTAASAPPRGVPPREVATLNDGGGRVALDGRGELSGLEGLSREQEQAVKRVLRGQGLSLPPELKELSGSTGVLMGGRGEAVVVHPLRGMFMGGEGEAVVVRPGSSEQLPPFPGMKALMEGAVKGTPFTLIRPVGVVVRSDRPTLTWLPLSGASEYSVSIYDQKYNEVAESPPLSAPEWTVPEALRRGGVYMWQVTAFKDLSNRRLLIARSPVRPAPDAKFKVLGKEEADELARASELHPNSHLLLGTLYARAGLLEEAEREFQLLLAANEKSALARKLLRDIQAKRAPVPVQ